MSPTVSCFRCMPCQMHNKFARKFRPHGFLLQNELLLERVVGQVLLAETQKATDVLLEAESRGIFRSAKPLQKDGPDVFGALTKEAKAPASKLGRIAPDLYN